MEQGPAPEKSSVAHDERGDLGLKMGGHWAGNSHRRRNRNQSFLKGPGRITRGNRQQGGKNDKTLNGK